jgi:signal peptide peptidase SppA
MNDTPSPYLAIDPAWLAAMLERAPMLAARPARLRPYSEETPLYQMDGRVAVLDAYGALSRSDSYWMSYFGGASTERLRAALAAADADPNVDAILLRVNSPGGDVDGIEPLAEDLVAVGARKRIVAYIEGMCCSAAYWLAAQCDQIYAEGKTPPIGSIGIVTAIRDTSEMYRDMGVKVYPISSDDLKNGAVAGAKVSKAQLAAMQETVDALYSQFVAAVATGRKLAEETVRGFGANVYLADKAAEIGLIDGVASYSAVMQQLAAANATRRMAKPGMTAPASPGRGTKPMSLWDQFKAALGGGDDTEPPAAKGAFTLIQASESPKVAELTDEINTLKAENATLKAKAELGERFRSALITDAKAEAVRAFGAEQGEKYTANLEALTAEAVETLRDNWKAIADRQFPPQGASRASAPAGRIAGFAEEADGTPKSAWDRLTDAQKAQAKVMGLDKDPQKRETFAENVLAYQS